MKITQCLFTLLASGVALHGLAGSLPPDPAEPRRAPVTLKTVSAASLREGPLAREMAVISFGADLATGTLQANPEDPPSVLAGTSVKLVDSAGQEGFARIFSVSPKQVNWLTPDWLADGPATVTVRDEGGRESTGQIEVTAIAPGLFSLNGSGTGIAAAGAVRRLADGSEQTLKTYLCGAAPNSCISIHLDPTEAGEIILTLYATGVRRAEKVAARIGGEEVEVLDVRPQAQALGAEVIVVRVPASLAGRGEVTAILLAGGVESNAVGLAIGPAPHKVTSVQPRSLYAGDSGLAITFGGSDLSDVNEVRFYPGEGITVTGLQASAAAVTATVQASSGVVPGDLVGALISTRGRSDPFTMSVVAPRPRVTKITPSSGPAGSSTQIRIDGENLAGVTAVRFSPPDGVTVSNLTAASTQVSATVAITSGAALGVRNVSVVSAAGTSDSLPFTVSAPPVPAISSLAPASGRQGETIASFRITGTNLAGVDKVEFSPSEGITVSAVSATDSAVSAQVSISRDARPGDRSVTVSAGALKSNALTFRVTATQPKLTGISPSRGSLGQTIRSLRFTGEGLAGADAIRISPPDGVVVEILSAKDTEVLASIKIAALAPTGERDLAVRVGTTWLTGVFTIFVGTVPPVISNVVVKVDVPPGTIPSMIVSASLDFKDPDGDVFYNEADPPKGGGLEMSSSLTCSAGAGRVYTGMTTTYRGSFLDQPGITAGRVVMGASESGGYAEIQEPATVIVTLIDGAGRRSNPVSVAVRGWGCGRR